MAVQTTLASLSQTAASNGPDGASDPPSALDDQQRYHGSFIASLRDGKGFAAEVDVASAATTDIGAANSLHVRITGTTTITSFGTAYNGPRFIRFGGALTLTHNASTLILPGGANITTAAGDTCEVWPVGSPGSGWVVGNYQRAALSTLTSGTTVSTSSGTSFDFTGIPSWVKRITIMFAGVSTNGSANLMVQIGDSGGIETTGYLGAATQTANATSVVSANFTTGFGVTAALSAVSVVHGSMTLNLVDAATNLWVAGGQVAFSDPQTQQFAGSKTLSATLDRVRITTTTGASLFDAGSVNIIYE